jgi:hypothetical protein
MCDENYEGRIVFYDWPHARLYNPSNRSFLVLSKNATADMLRAFCAEHGLIYREPNPLPSHTRGTWAIVD